MPNASTQMIHFSPKDKERFWQKVNKDGPIHPYSPELGQCWLWAASTMMGGYGWFGMNVPQDSGRARWKGIRASRISFLFSNGEWPMPQCLHSCDRAACVNPAHLRAGTHAENNKDCDSRNRRRARKGTRHGMAKLTEANVIEIRRLYGTGLFQRQIASRFGIHQMTISKIVRRIYWKHLP